MATIHENTELRDALAQLMDRKRDPELMRKAAERMDREREELRQRIGEVNVAVVLIREARDET
jgi:hypothetical protein